MSPIIIISTIGILAMLLFGKNPKFLAGIAIASVVAIVGLISVSLLSNQNEAEITSVARVDLQLTPTAEAVDQQPDSETKQVDTNDICTLDPSWKDYPDVYRWKSLIKKACKKSGVEANIIAAVMRQESRGDPNAESDEGAIGLMQIMSKDGLSGRKYPAYFYNRPTVKQLKDPEFNIKWGAQFLKSKIDESGSLEAGLFNYNGGHPDYVPLVLGFYNSHKTNQEKNHD